MRVEVVEANMWGLCVMETQDNSSSAWILI